MAAYTCTRDWLFSILCCLSAPTRQVRDRSSCLRGAGNGDATSGRADFDWTMKGVVDCDCCRGSEWLCRTSSDHPISVSNPACFAIPTLPEPITSDLDLNSPDADLKSCRPRRRCAFLSTSSDAPPMSTGWQKLKWGGRDSCRSPMRGISCAAGWGVGNRGATTFGVSISADINVSGALFSGSGLSIPCCACAYLSRFLSTLPTTSSRFVAMC